MSLISSFSITTKVTALTRALSANQLVRLRRDVPWFDDMSLMETRRYPTLKPLGA